MPRNSNLSGGQTISPVAQTISPVGQTIVFCGLPAMNRKPAARGSRAAGMKTRLITVEQDGILRDGYLPAPGGDTHA